MKDKVRELLVNVELNVTTLLSEELIAIIERFNFKFPDSYLSLIKEFNGGEGEVGNESWLCLFPIEELDNINRSYGLLMSDIPDYFLIGKDTADTGYAIHKINGTFHSFGLMSNFKTDHIEFLGNDLVEFLEYLENAL